MSYANLRNRGSRPSNPANVTLIVGVVALVLSLINSAIIIHFVIKANHAANRLNEYRQRLER